MPVTLKQVLAHLEREEPDYSTAAKLGEGAVSHLLQIVKNADFMLASKATYLASLIDSDESKQVLEKAAMSDHIEVRIAAASGIQNLKQAPITLVDNLLKDTDLGVRKVALHSIEARPIKGMKVKIEEIAQKDSEVFIKNLASKIAKKLE